MPGLPPESRGRVAVALARSEASVPGVPPLPAGAVYELKWDGYRVAVVRDDAGAKLWSRHGKDLTDRFPDLAAAVVAQGAVGPDVDLLGSLQSGWDALVDHGDATQVMTDIERDHDLDDDAVAATYYALTSVQGQAGAAWWAASRAMDQAFAAVEYPEDASTFRPVEADAPSAVVQSENDPPATSVEGRRVGP